MLSIYYNVAVDDGVAQITTTAKAYFDRHHCLDDGSGPDYAKGQGKIYTLTVKPRSLLPLAARSGARSGKMLRTAPKWAVRNFFAKNFWEQNRRFPFSASPDYIYYICSRVPKLKCEIFATFLIEFHL